MAEGCGRKIRSIQGWTIFGSICICQSATGTYILSNNACPISRQRLSVGIHWAFCWTSPSVCHLSPSTYLAFSLPPDAMGLDLCSLHMRRRSWH